MEGMGIILGAVAGAAAGAVIGFCLCRGASQGQVVGGMPKGVIIAESRLADVYMVIEGALHGPSGRVVSTVDELEAAFHEHNENKTLSLVGQSGSALKFNPDVSKWNVSPDAAGTMVLEDIAIVDPGPFEMSGGSLWYVAVRFDGRAVVRQVTDSLNWFAGSVDGKR